MAVYVYNWPDEDCLCIMREKWTHLQPVATQQSLLTGRVYKAIYGRERVEAALTIDGSVYCGDCRASDKMSVMMRQLEGGLHYVRLRYTPKGLSGDLEEKEVFIDNAYAPIEIPWDDGGVDRLWQDGPRDQPWTYQAATAPTVGIPAGATEVTLRRQTPGVQLACAGTYLRIGTERVLITSSATADATGDVTIKFTPALTAEQVVSTVWLNSYDEAIFQVTQFPDVTRDYTSPTSAEAWDWRFREVFADEIGTFTERTFF